tara:strand:+ start:103 stop:1026 length:924 start_codon:yes stop_codon:yes gene_type:complete
MKYYLSAALTIKTKWFDSLKEWFLWNKFIGVEHFYIVDDNKGKPLGDFFRNFSSDITFIEDVEADSNIPQRDLFKKIYNEYGHESHWLAFIDDDEYIMSLQELSFLSFLKSVENKSGVELASRFFGPHGYKKHEGLKCHENNLTLDRYWLYESKPIVKTIVNSRMVERLSDGGSVHRLLSEGAIDCFGNPVESLSETQISNDWGFDDKVVNNAGRVHNPRFVINHYGLRSLEEIEYKLFERGFAEGERISDEGVTYRAHKLLKQLFSTTKHNNLNHKGDFNYFYFKSCLPTVRLEFKRYCEDHKDKF